MKKLTKKQLREIYINPDKINWLNISAYQKLSEEFRERFKHRL